jgi:O-acetyl-ADP-ribose deacetylase (regulator of RNase III)
VDETRVTRETFQGLGPLSEPAAIPAPTRRWSEAEWRRIRLGHRSTEMEDKWDAFVEDHRLFFHRSWTGSGIYEADFVPDGRDWVVTAARVTGDRDVYARSTDHYETLMLEALIGGVLLGRCPEDFQERLDNPTRAKKPRIEAVLGDITHERVEAIVNAANETLRGGGGVDGAIHRGAGPRLAQAGAALAPCHPGDAKATPAFDLDPPVAHVIHTVGPVWHGGGRGEAQLLESCYRRCLEVADQLGVRSVAFPAISTGVYGYPPELAADVAVRALRNASTSVEVTRLVAFDEGTYQLYLERLA